MYTNKELTTTASSGTYTQQGSDSPTTHCNTTSEYMAMVLNSSGVITSIGCGLP
jgi:hypothetical protein